MQCEEIQVYGHEILLAAGLRGAGAIQGREQNIADDFTKDLPTKEFTSMRAFIVPEGRRKSVKELVGTSKAGSQEGAADRMVCEGVFTTETVVSLKDTANHKPHNRTYHAVLVESLSNLNL
jgi:hypothetical protein